MYERCIFDQVYCYSNQILSKHQCGFQQGHSTQYSLILTVKKLKKRLNNSGVGRLLLTDLSKAFNFLRQDVLMVKLAAYGFDQPSLCFIFSYLSGKPQRTKVSNASVTATGLEARTTLVSLAKWLNVHLGTEWFWVQVQLQSLKHQILRLIRERSSLTFRQQ